MKRVRIELKDEDIYCYYCKKENFYMNANLRPCRYCGQIICHYHSHYVVYCSNICSFKVFFFIVFFFFWFLGFL